MAREKKGKRLTSSSSPSNDPDLLARCDLKARSLENGWQLGSVLEDDVVELDRATFGPGRDGIL
jgi:hypothetical protein